LRSWGREGHPKSRWRGKVKRKFLKEDAFSRTKWIRGVWSLKNGEIPATSVNGDNTG